jgi:peptidoglycan-N-acetylglucosamine deacetylase
VLTLTAEIASVAATASLGAGAWWYAAMWPESEIFGPVLVAGDDPRQLALTFDDGPNHAATPQLLDVLARHEVRATFFVIGSFVRQQPELVRAIVDAGHLVGNHTMSHVRLMLQPAELIRKELMDCNAAIEDATGQAIRYFRPPYGARRPFVLRAARELGLTPVLWNVAGVDWNPDGVDAILENLEFGIERNRRRKRASNILLHDGGHLTMGMMRLDTVRAVDRLITEHRGTETEFVTLDAWTS